jgi:parallel beta-helix repeat protein
VYIKDSRDIILEDTIISNTTRFSVDIRYSTHVKLVNTTFKYNNEYEFYTVLSSYVSLINSTFIDDGMFLWKSTQLDVVNTFVNGKPLLYLEDKHGMDVTGDYGQVFINNCSNITVHDMNISNTFVAIGVYRSSNIRVVYNTVSGNDIGIGVYESDTIVIAGNTAVDNHDDIVLYNDEDITIYSNNIMENIHGIVIRSSLNIIIYHNNFINNTQQARIVSGKYAWDAGYPVVGNYWSDYKGRDQYSGPYQDIPGSDGIGDKPYLIDYYSIDHYPLMKPVETSRGE